MNSVIGKWLTVVIRDDAPIIHSNDAPSYRSVRLELTSIQRAKLAMSQHEAISPCFVEPFAEPDQEPANHG